MRKLSEQAERHGVSLQEEVIQLLEVSVEKRVGGGEDFLAALAAMPEGLEDWMLDRNDPRNKMPDKAVEMFDV